MGVEDALDDSVRGGDRVGVGGGGGGRLGSNDCGAGAVCFGFDENWDDEGEGSDRGELGPSRAPERPNSSD